MTKTVIGHTYIHENHEFMQKFAIFSTGYVKGYIVVSCVEIALFYQSF